MKFILGTTLRDRVSGFAGIAHSCTEFMTGNVQFSLQPPAKDGTLPELICFDAHQLEVVADAPSVPLVPAPVDTGIVLGEEYADIVSGAKGIATKKTTFLNGCVYYTLVAKRDEKKGEFYEFFHEWKRLEYTGAGVRRRLQAQKETPMPAEKTGGPIQRGMPARG